MSTSSTSDFEFLPLPPATAPLRVALLCRSLPWHRAGGLESHTWSLVSALLAEGHTVHLVTTPASPGAGRSRREAMLGGLRAGARERLHLLETGAARDGRYSLEYVRAAASHARTLGRAGAIDVIHAQGFAAFGLAVRGARAGDVAWVATIHGTLWSETELDFRAREGASLGRRAALAWRYKHRFAAWPLWRATLARATRLLVDSRFTRDELLRESPSLEPKVRVVPLGMDPPGAGAAASAGPGGEGPIRLLALGRLVESKGIAIVLRALAKLPQPVPPLELRIGGDGPARPSLELLARELGLLANGAGARVVFAGRIADEQLAAEYARADLFLHPDLTHPAFGLVVAEAMLQGTPVLASHAGALPEVLGTEGGWTAAPGDVDAWAVLLARVLGDRGGLAARRPRVAADARARFSAIRMARLTASVYAEVIRRRG